LSYRLDRPNHPNLRSEHSGPIFSTAFPSCLPRETFRCGCVGLRMEASLLISTMANKSKFQAIKGTRDLLPPETALWNRVEQTAHDVFGTFGFGEIRLPVFEPTELFSRSIGLDTDVVSKEMYSWVDNAVPRLGSLADVVISWPDPIQTEDQFSAYKRYVSDFVKELERAIDRDELPKSPVNQQALQDVREKFETLSQASVDNPEGKKLAGECIKAIRLAVRFAELGDYLTLRPEATASVCRAYIEHSLQQLPQPVKLYYIGPMFRRERPQKGRYRQFYQIGAEVLGGQDAPGVDAEVIEMLMTFFDKLELKGIELDINSIGHNAPSCRPAYVELLRAELTKVKDQLGPDSQRRIDTNPLRVLDSKVESEQAIIATLPHIADHLCPDCAAHYAAVKQQLQLRGVIYRENWRLVRGLDYYMRTTFEITAQGLGSQNAVCGGGRYDGLVELLGGAPTKGIGFAIGEDRLILSLLQQARPSATASEAAAGPSRLTLPPSLDVYIAWMGEHAYATAVRAAKDLRQAGFSVELPPTELKFGKALSHADKLSAKFALILGDNEVSEGLWTLKTLADGTQQKLPEPALIEHLRNSLRPL
jgi:histidyl-tRNA synthetase